MYSYLVVVEFLSNVHRFTKIKNYLCNGGLPPNPLLTSCICLLIL